MSLFGLDPNTIQQNRTNKAVSQASAMNPYFAAGAAGGALVGQSVNNMFGLQTPEMEQAQSVKDSMSGADLTTVAGLRAAAQKLMVSGDYAQAMALHSEARDMEAASNAAANDTDENGEEEYESEVYMDPVIYLTSSKDGLGMEELLLSVENNMFSVGDVYDEDDDGDEDDIELDEDDIELDEDEGGDEISVN